MNEAGNLQPASNAAGRFGFEVANWTPHLKNTLRAFFTLIMPSGMVLHGCTYHQKNVSRWTGVPSQNSPRRTDRSATRRSSSSPPMTPASGFRNRQSRLWTGIWEPSHDGAYNASPHYRSG